MNFNELDLTLPNGFHDASLRHFEMNYVNHTLNFDLDVSVGTPEEEQEFIRPARVTVKNVAFLVVESPYARDEWLKAGPIWIDTGEGAPDKGKSELPEVSKGTSTTWMYLREMNSFIIFAGGEASIEWTGAKQPWKK
jgi:hypothetical protein